MANAQAASASRSLVGAVFSRRWRLVQKLGQGGMGEVYAADPASPGPTAAPAGGRVALKVLRPEFVGNADVLSRFLDESRTCARLIHPNIVRVFECAQAEDGTPYFVMELLDGVPLGAYTQNGGRVPVAQAVPILQGILAGLAAAHAQGIVHRDLKPDNVFLTRDVGGTFVVKVLDFGIAKVMDLAGGMGHRTRTGILLGTPAYMSPEQAKNARDVDQRADLWSAGVLFYEMLTGRAAFPAPTDYARLAAVLSTEPEPIQQIDPALASLGAFFERALKKVRDERFSSALEMARSLSLVVPGGAAPISAAPRPLSRLPDVPSAYLPHSTVRANALPATLGSPAAAAPVDGSAAAAGGARASSPAPPVVEGSPHVVMVGSQAVGETLPSKDLPMFSRGQLRVVRGISPSLLVVLVAGALVAGLLLGWALAHMS
jgi:serine/threonine-protein kinase